MGPDVKCEASGLKSIARFVCAVANSWRACLVFDVLVHLGKRRVAKTTCLQKVRAHFVRIFCFRSRTCSEHVHVRLHDHRLLSTGLLLEALSGRVRGQGTVSTYRSGAFLSKNWIRETLMTIVLLSGAPVLA